jgi:hypothetical protein
MNKPKLPVHPYAPTDPEALAQYLWLGGFEVVDRDTLVEMFGAQDLDQKLKALEQRSIVEIFDWGSSNPTIHLGEKAVFCDLCGKCIIDLEKDLTHHTGILHGKPNDHVHVCQACGIKYNFPVINFDHHLAMPCVWEDDPQYPSSVWQQAVVQGATRLGYREWVLAQKGSIQFLEA